MRRINKLIKNPTFIHILNEIEKYETSRVYCKHGLNHSLDVARIAYIINLERNMGFPKELIYAVALVHDIGRFEQYNGGRRHSEASMRIAKPILKESGFLDWEISIIENAVENHQKMSRGNTFNSLIYLADKKSRNCFHCEAQKDCNWPSSKKNKRIDV